MDVDYPKRKHVRLKNYDYSRNGIYFVTSCTQNRRCILSQIVLPHVVGAEMVGRGLAPAAPPAHRMRQAGGRRIDGPYGTISVCLDRKICDHAQSYSCIDLPARRYGGGKPPPYVDAGSGDVEIIDNAAVEWDDWTTWGKALAIRLP